MLLSAVKLCVGGLRQTAVSPAILVWSPYQTNTDRRSHISLNNHCINITHTSNMFQPLQGHLQEEWYIRAAWANKINHKFKKFNILCSVPPHTMLNFIVWWLILFTHAARMYQTLWIWPFKCWHMLEIRMVLTEWRFNDIWVYLCVFVWWVILAHGYELDKVFFLCFADRASPYNLSK